MGHVGEWGGGGDGLGEPRLLHISFVFFFPFSEFLCRCSNIYMILFIMHFMVSGDPCTESKIYVRLLLLFHCHCSKIVFPARRAGFAKAQPMAVVRITHVPFYGRISKATRPTSSVHKFFFRCVIVRIIVPSSHCWGLVRHINAYRRHETGVFIDSTKTRERFNMSPVYRRQVWVSTPMAPVKAGRPIQQLFIHPHILNQRIVQYYNDWWNFMLIVDCWSGALARLFRSQLVLKSINIGCCALRVVWLQVATTP